jgi:small subunit ribosomal protein S4
MAKYRGPRIRIVRRLGELPALTRKTTRRDSRPGQHGAARIKPSPFSIRLAEKQKLRYYYGVTESQLVRYVRQARRAKGSTGEILLQQLERRLDNIIYRLGFAPTLPASRQLVSHGHVQVNGKQVTIASYPCRPGEVVTVRTKELSRNRVRQALAQTSREIPAHLSLNRESLTARVQQRASRQEVPLAINELLVVEFFSNRL